MICKIKIIFFSLKNILRGHICPNRSLKQLFFFLAVYIPRWRVYVLIVCTKVLYVLIVLY